MGHDKDAMEEEEFYDGEDPLHTAARLDDVDKLNDLISDGADLTVKSLFDDSILHTATRYGSLKCMEALILAGR